MKNYGMEGFSVRMRTWKRTGILAMTGLGIYSALDFLHTPRFPDQALRSGFQMVAKKRSVLAFSAHPGDLEFFAGGTMSLLKQADCPITVVVLSAGERSSNRLNIREIRQREQEQASRVLGYDRLEFWEMPDHQMDFEQVMPLIRSVWDQSSPELVLAPSSKQPWGLWPNRDHRLLGQVIQTIVQMKTNRTPELYFYAPRYANASVDITEVIQEKMNAVMVHRSQMAGPDKWNHYGVKLFSRLGSRRIPALYIERFQRINQGS